MVAEINLYRKGKDKSLPSLIFIHPVTGLSACYKQLLSNLDIEEDIWVVESPLYDSTKSTQINSLEKLIEEVADTINDKIGKDTYHLAGWSYGSIMAYEVATKLIEPLGLNKQVEKVFLIDPPSTLLSELNDADFLEYFKMTAQDIIRNRPDLCLTLKENIAQEPSALKKEELIKEPGKFILHHIPTVQAIESAEAETYYANWSKNFDNFNKMLNVIAKHMQFATEYEGPSGSVKYLINIKAEKSIINDTKTSIIDWDNNAHAYEEITIPHVNHFEIIDSKELAVFIQNSLKSTKDNGFSKDIISCDKSASIFFSESNSNSSTSSTNINNLTQRYTNTF